MPAKATSTDLMNWIDHLQLCYGVDNTRYSTRYEPASFYKVDLHWLREHQASWECALYA